MYDALSKLVYSKNLNNEIQCEVDLTGMPSGIYYANAIDGKIGFQVLQMIKQ